MVSIKVAVIWLGLGPITYDEVISQLDLKDFDAVVSVIAVVSVMAVASVWWHTTLYSYAFLVVAPLTLTLTLTLTLILTLG